MQIPGPSHWLSQKCTQEMHKVLLPYCVQVTAGLAQSLPQSIQLILYVIIIRLFCLGFFLLCFNLHLFCVCVVINACATASTYGDMPCTYGSFKDQFPFFHHVGPGDATPVNRLDGLFLPAISSP